ncbi:MAG TPA: hypothetical protein VFK82_12035 [Burkholderiaceae bacterium]|nr:hypothetical protein [Burkholderiaceae bacterium]
MRWVFREGEIVIRLVFMSVLVLALAEQPLLARERAPQLLAQGPVPHGTSKPVQPASMPRTPVLDPASKKPEPAQPSAPATEPRAPAATGSAVGPRRLSAEERAQLREQIRDMRRRYGTDQPGTSGS